MKYLILVICILSVFTLRYMLRDDIVDIRYMLRDIVDSRQTPQSAVMSYGYNDATQLWNCIRVNDKGQILCAKESE